MFEHGEVESAVLAAGQVVGLIRDIPTVQELMDRIIREARDHDRPFCRHPGSSARRS